MNKQGRSFRLGVWLCAFSLPFMLIACSGGGEATEQSQAPEIVASDTSAPAATNTSAPAATEKIEPSTTVPPFELNSPGFAEGEVIPARYACTGDDLSPELNWGSAPADTESLALIFDDPDAPGGTWVHWVLFNLPADMLGLPEGIDPIPVFADGSVNGANSWGALGYGGPCPPPGSTHRYIFTLFALDTILDLSAGSSKAQVLDAMEEHIIDQAVYGGIFSR